MREYVFERLADILAEAHINSAGVATRAGISHTALRKLKMGSVPSANTLVAIADTVGKPLDYFFEEKRNYSAEQGAA